MKPRHIIGVMFSHELQNKNHGQSANATDVHTAFIDLSMSMTVHSLDCSSKLRIIRHNSGHVVKHTLAAMSRTFPVSPFDGETLTPTGPFPSHVQAEPCTSQKGTQVLVHDCPL